VEGRVISIAEIQQLANLPSKEELISKIMFLLNAPAQRIATALNALPRNLAVTVNEAIKAKKFGSDDGALQPHLQQVPKQLSEILNLEREERIMAKVDTILEEIKGLTLLEASDLVKKMEEAFGVSAAAATVVAGGGGGAAAGAAPAEERRNSPLFSPTWRQQDQRHQGGSRSHQPGLEGSQGFGGRAPKTVKEA